MINPWNLSEIKKSLKTALTISEAQKITNHSHLLSYVKKFTSSHWGKTFIADLELSTNADVNFSIVPIFSLSNIMHGFNSKNTVITL